MHSNKAGFDDMYYALLISTDGGSIPQTIVGGPGDDVVQGSGRALDPYDVLVGGGGFDTLVIQDGHANLQNIETFTGFEKVQLWIGSSNSPGSSDSSLILGDQSLVVEAEGRPTIQLGSGAVTFTSFGPA